MSSSENSQKVLIIGAGVGGLGLAQLLRKQGIPFEIFERDASLDSRKQGWAIALVECVPDLEELLPKDIGDIGSISVNARAGIPDSMGVISGASGQKLGELGGVPRGQPGYIIRANRKRCREFLWQNLPVQLGKHFSHYEADSNGVTVHFKDGTSARGSILVGADGVNSRVRSQLLNYPEGHLGLELSHYCPIVGEVVLPKDKYEPLFNLGSAGLLSATTKARYLAAQQGIDYEHEVAAYYWIVCFYSEDPVASSHWVSTADKQSLYNKVVELTKGMTSILTDVIHETGPAGISDVQVKFNEYVSPESLPRSRVTLLGDAAHTMVPFRGAGANTALKDACDLARLLIEASGSHIDIEDMLQEYASIMLPRGRDQVLISRRAGEGDPDEAMKARLRPGTLH